MKLTKLSIKNFRCLADVTVPLDDVTVLIGENNSGKSAVLDALRLCFRRSPNRQSSVVQDYDFRLTGPDANPRESPEIAIEARFAEEQSGEWPSGLNQDLENIEQLDPVRDLRRIHLKFQAKFDQASRAYQSGWEFLDEAGQLLPVRGGEAEGVRRLNDYAPIFHLPALRDAVEQFGQRSSYWAPLLRALEIPEAKRQELASQMEALNRQLLEADPRLAQVTGTLEGMGNVMAEVTGQTVQVRALPMRPWDLLSRSQVVVRSSSAGTDLPLDRHGQGLQTLAVLYLFQAFIDHVWSVTAPAGAEPILTLEEPEAHLHPQAARTLWHEIRQLKGQKVVASHSPYFVQYVPFRKLRVLRKTASGTSVHWLPGSYTEQLPPGNSALEQHCQTVSDLDYRTETGDLTTVAPLTEDEVRKILVLVRPEDHPVVRRLQAAAAQHLPDPLLARLESAARRTRGEILFARVWVFCEGESDLRVLRAFARSLGIDLDLAGVSLIDCQNGLVGCADFARLARGLGYPWFGLCDGDQGGAGWVRGMLNAGFLQDEIDRSLTRLPAGQAIETFLVENGLENELAQVALEMASFNEDVSTPAGKTALSQLLGQKKNKTEWAIRLEAALEQSPLDGSRIPKLLADLIRKAVQAGA